MQATGSPVTTESQAAACARQEALRSAREAMNAANAALHRAAGRVKACGQCAAEFCPLYGSSLAAFCQPCADARQRAQHKAAKSLRKALQRGANGGERFDPLEVFARDGWRCQLCKRKTPQERRGTYAPDAPELDHIVPVSLGGLHAWSNTQCARRDCNGKKGARAFGQLVLT